MSLMTPGSHPFHRDRRICGSLGNERSQLAFVSGGAKGRVEAEYESMPVGNFQTAGKVALSHFILECQSLAVR